MSSVGRHGSPGKVEDFETLHSVLIGPGDLDRGQIAMTVITHAEKKGMSILRGAASNREFETIIVERTQGNPQRWFHGIALLSSADVRALTAPNDTGQRLLGDRLYCVLDADMVGLPHHADIFVTVPRPHGNKSSKAAWRAERGRLMALAMGNLSSPVEFRQGALAGHAPLRSER